MANSKVVLIPDVGSFYSSNLNMIKDVSLEAEGILPIFSGDNSPKDFLKEVLGYDVDAHIEAAYLVPLNNARLDAVNQMLYGDSIPLLGPDATEKQIKGVVAALKTEKSDLEHYIKAELDDFADGDIQYSKEDLTRAIRAATAQQIQEIVPPHLREKYGTELDAFAAYLDDGDSPLSESGHVSLIRNEAGNFETSEYLHKGVPIVLVAAAAYALSQIFGGAGGTSKDVIHESEVTYDNPQVLAGDTPDSPNQSVQDENVVRTPDWLIQKKNWLGKEYFEIDRDMLPLEIPGLKLVEGNDDKQDDGKITPNDGVPEMAAGIDREYTPYGVDGGGVLIVDNDFFKEYERVIMQRDEEVGMEERGALMSQKEVFCEISPGVYAQYMPILNVNQIRFTGDGDPKGPVIAYKREVPKY